LRHLATEFHIQSRGSAEARTLSAALQIQGLAVGRFLEGRLMKEARLFSSHCHKHRYRKAGGESPIAANELDRQFTVSGPNQVWCGDVTYIWAGIGGSTLQQS
jgi:putative transposase